MATSTALVGFCPETQPIHKSEEWTSVVASTVEALPGQQEWSGSWDWRNAEEEALLEWCNNAQQECTSQPEPCLLSPVPDEHMKRFLLLKSKIIDTHKLIKKYQDKEKALKTATEKLVEVQASCTALRSELQLQHELNGSLSEQLNTTRKQLEETLEDTSHQKILIQQLTAKLEETESERDLMLHGRAGRNHLKSELDQLRREFKAFKKKSSDPLYKFNHMLRDVTPLNSDPLSHLPAVRSTGKRTKPSNMYESDQDSSETDDDDEQEDEKPMVEKVKELVDEDDDSDSDGEEDLLADMLCQDVPQTIAYSPKCNTDNTANGNLCTREQTVPLDSYAKNTQECMEPEDSFIEQHMEPLDDFMEERTVPLDSSMKNTQECMEPEDSFIEQHMEPLDDFMEERTVPLDSSIEQHIEPLDTENELEHTVPLDNSMRTPEHTEPTQNSCMNRTEDTEPLDTTQNSCMNRTEHTEPLETTPNSCMNRTEHTEPLETTRNSCMNRTEHTEPLEMTRNSCMNRTEHTEPLETIRNSCMNRTEHTEPLETTWNSCMNRTHERKIPTNSHMNKDTESYMKSGNRRQECTGPLVISGRQEHTEPLSIYRTQEHTEPRQEHAVAEPQDSCIKSAIKSYRTQECTEPLEQPLDISKIQEHAVAKPLDSCVIKAREHTEPLDSCRRQEHTGPLDSRRSQEHTEQVNSHRRQEHTKPLDSHEALKPRESQKRQQQNNSPSQSKRVRLTASPTPSLLPTFSPLLPSPVPSCLGPAISGPVSLAVAEQAEADTATSVESDSDSMDSMWHPSQFSRLQTVSPLPPSPLSPSPLSPLSFFPPLFATLSPIPPSPNRATISPLPMSPPYLHSPPLPQFSSLAPTEQCVHPTPLTPSASTSSIISPPPQRLKRSLSSSFSPQTKLTCSPSTLPLPLSPIAFQNSTQPSNYGAADYISHAKKKEVLPPITSQNLLLDEEEEGEIVESPTPPPILSQNCLLSTEKEEGELIETPLAISSQNSLLSTEKEEGELIESPTPLAISSLPSSPLLIHVPDPSSPGSPCPLSILDQEGEIAPSFPLLIPGPSALLSSDSQSSLSIVVMDSSVQHCQPEPTHADSDLDSVQQSVEEKLPSQIPGPSNPNALSSLSSFANQQHDGVLIQPLAPTQSVGYSNPAPPPPAKRPKLDKATGQELKAGSSRSSSSSTSPDLSCPPSEFSFAQPLPPSQREVHPTLRSPHPLPVWLTSSLVAVQDAANHSITKGNNRKKKKKGSGSINRYKKQSPASYASCSLSRLMDGLITMPTATKMFSNPDNAPSAVVLAKSTVTYLCQHYHPRFESVLSLCWDKCLAASQRLINPLDSSYIPPLLKPECVLLSLLVTTAFTNPKMNNLLPELTKALKETILTNSSGFGFHHLCACCRMFAALCRLQNDIEQIQFVACELLLKSMSSNNLPTITALASIWPRAFARNHVAPPVQIGDQLKTEGVDMQPLSLTLEVVMVDVASKKKELQDKGPISNLKKLCQWQQLPGQAVAKLTKCLVEILVSSKHVFIDAPSTLTPRPSKHAYAVVLALRVLSCSQGWAWTNDTLIRGHLWPLLQQWNRAPASVRDPTIVCITRLIGFTAQIGVAEDPNSSSIQQLQKVFISLLQKEKMKKVSLCVQLAVADALIDLSPCSSSSSVTTSSTISQWITQLCQEGIATAPAMAQLYGPRLQQIKS